jgi:hypothetical protein
LTIQRTLSRRPKLGERVQGPGSHDEAMAFGSPPGPLRSHAAVFLRDRIPATRPLWADFVIAALVFWIVLLPLEYGGTPALVLAVVVASAVLVLLLAGRWRRRM